jgi:hypothetical protein
MTQAEIQRWIADHKETHRNLVSREVYDRDHQEFKDDLTAVKSALTKFTWALVSLLIAVVVDVLTRVLEQQPPFP